MQPPTDAEESIMREALGLAMKSIGLSDPNPRVGCIITDPAGRILGRGFTQQAGGPHAEIMALRDAANAQENVHGAHAYVTLEPCSHHGRTPPCCDALIAAGLQRIVVAVQDPNPLVAEQGIARLRAAGITVEVGLLAAEATEINIGFFSRMQRHRPWVRLKAAVSLDGRSALDNGVSQWITGEAARVDGHLWRKRASAVLTGIGTVLKDNPRMDVRLVETSQQPLRVIVDSQLGTPPAARILEAPGNVLIYAAQLDATRSNALHARGAEITLCPAPTGKVDLPALLSDLATRGVNELHVETGHTLSGAFVQEGLVDEFLIYLAPKLLGSGRALAAFGPIDKLEDAVTLHYTSIERVGADLRVIARL